MSVSEIEVHVEVVEIAGVPVHCVGLETTHRSYSVTGAAAALTEPPFARAYYELIERVTIVEARSTTETTDPFQRLSVSNGVAVQLDAQRARRSAALELFERDRVLRSWYGGMRPRLLDVQVAAWPAEFEHHYTIRAYEFADGVEWTDGDAYTVGVFAFPRRREAPLCVGFAARQSIDDALLAAGREFLQQAAFGWGQPVPDECPTVAPTPEFHLDFFAYPGNHARLERWLEGAHEGQGPTLPTSAGEFRFEDLTPPWSQGVCVARAVHRAALPLVFGLGHPLLTELPEFMQVHPIA
jgi:hypothetical protein